MHPPTPADHPRDDAASRQLARTLAEVRKALQQPLAPEPETEHDGLSPLGAALTIANQHFGTDYAVLARVEQDRYHVQAVSRGAPVAPGLSCPLAETLCAVTMRGRGVVHITPVSLSPLATLPTLANLPTETYLAVPLDVLGGGHGTLSFHAAHKRETSTPGLDRELLLGTASWLEHALGRSAARTSFADDSAPFEPSDETLSLVGGPNHICFFCYTREQGFRWSRAATNVFGHHHGPAPAAHDPAWLWAQVHPSDRARVKAIVEQLTTGKRAVAQSTFRISTPDKDERIVRATVSRLVPAEDDSAPSFSGSLQDVSGLQHEVIQLRRRVTELDDFNRIVAHDILTPLRHANKLAGILREDHGALLGDEGLRYLTMIQSSASRGLSMLHALRELTQASGQTRTPAMINVRTLIAEVADEVEVVHGRPGSQTRLPEDDHIVWSYPAELALVFSNILSNAFKYGGDPQEVTVRVESRANETVFHVGDNGPGIPDRDKERVFQPFCRLPSNRDQPGMGVGLTIVDKMVDICGGSVRIGDGPSGRGTVVSMSLPHRALPLVELPDQR